VGQLSSLPLPAKSRRAGWPVRWRFGIQENILPEAFGMILLFLD
jgi:hypothetical protein